MESALSKTGIYELLGGFIPGMIAIATWIYLDLPAILLEKVDDNLKVTFFLVESYFLA